MTRIQQIGRDGEVTNVVLNDEPITAKAVNTWERQPHEDVSEWIARTTQLGYKIRHLSTFEIGELILELKHMPEHRVKITQLWPDQYNVEMWRLP